MSKQGGWRVKVNRCQHKPDWRLSVHWHVCCGCYWEEEHRLLATSLQLQFYSCLWWNFSGENPGYVFSVTSGVISARTWLHIFYSQGIQAACGEHGVYSGFFQMDKWSVSYQSTSMMGLDGPFSSSAYIHCIHSKHCFAVILLHGKLYFKVFPGRGCWVTVRVSVRCSAQWDLTLKWQRWQRKCASAKGALHGAASAAWEEKYACARLEDLLFNTLHKSEDKDE